VPRGQKSEDRRSDEVIDRIEKADLQVDVTLVDGSTTHVRQIRPEDADDLVAFHGRLSKQTVTFRFFGPHPVLTEGEVEHFTNVDGVDRVALVAELAGQIVAVARYERSPGRDDAEVAFVVDDESQGKGIGTILLEHLVSVARSHGIRSFVVDTLSENYRMLHLLRDANFARRYERSAGVTHVVLDISPSPEPRQLS
jgi:GNAT superfamily N-acetyltransferase